VAQKSAKRVLSGGPVTDRDAHTVVTVIIQSTLAQPLRPELLANVLSQEVVHPFAVLVARSERNPDISALLKRSAAREVFGSDERRVAQSLLDHALGETDSELIAHVAGDLMPEGRGWLEALVGPLLERPALVATRGRVKARADQSPYAAFRFESERDDPRDLIVFRRDAWEKYPFHKSGNLGHRWAERIATEGAIEPIGEAIVRGGQTVPTHFRGIVAQTFINLPVGLSEGLRSAAQETLDDWDALRTRGLERPARVYAQAAMTRLAENLGRTRLRGLLGGKRRTE